MMTAEQLKASILQMAMQGKLVEQRPEEGTGEELYKEIQAEKKRLIKEGKIKRGKELPELTEEYDIPDTWRIVHLLSICESISDIDHKMPKAVDKENGIPFLAAKDINSDMTLNYTADIKYISLSDYERLRKKAEPKEGDIIFSRIGSLGKVGIVYSGERFLVSYSCCVIRPMLINRKYLAYCLQGPEMQMNARRAKTGIGVPDLGMAMIKAFAIPLPPLAEQKRIVAKVEELMPFVDQYAVASTKLNTLNASFPEMMKKSILQEAVQGKLVPQDPNDEPASLLLKKIAEEKKRLIKEGKIKKQKPLPEITEDEIPFDIPESWEWVRLSEVGMLQTGTTPSKAHPEYFGEFIPFVSPGDISSENVLTCRKDGLSKEGLDYARLIPAKSVLQVCIGGSIGKAAINDVDVTCNQQINTITPYFINEQYLFYCMTSDLVVSQIKANAGGTATPIINKSTWGNIIIPIAPLNEQRRVVAKIEEILSEIRVLCM